MEGLSPCFGVGVAVREVDEGRVALGTGAGVAGGVMGFEGAGEEERRSVLLHFRQGWRPRERKDSDGMVWMLA
jgi:hypothetical protein